MGYCGNEKEDAKILQGLLSCGYSRWSLPKSLFVHLVKPFTGAGTENISEYFDDLENRANYENWTESVMLSMFKMRLAGDGHTYFYSLDSADSLNYQKVKKAFLEEFMPSKLDGGRHFHSSRRRNGQEKWSERVASDHGKEQSKDEEQSQVLIPFEGGNKDDKQAMNMDTNKPKELDSYVDDIRGRDCSHVTSRVQFEVGNQIQKRSGENSFRRKTPGRNRGEDAVQSELSQDLEARWARLQGNRQEVVQVQEDTAGIVVGSGGENRPFMMETAMGNHSELVEEVDQEWQEVLAEIEAEIKDSEKGVEPSVKGWNKSTQDAAGARRNKNEVSNKASESRLTIENEKKIATRQDDCKKLGQVGLGLKPDDNVKDVQRVGVVVPYDTVIAARSDNLIPILVNAKKIKEHKIISEPRVVGKTTGKTDPSEERNCEKTSSTEIVNKNADDLEIDTDTADNVSVIQVCDIKMIRQMHGKGEFYVPTVQHLHNTKDFVARKNRYKDYTKKRTKVNVKCLDRAGTRDKDESDSESDLERSWRWPRRTLDEMRDATLTLLPLFHPTFYRRYNDEEESPKTEVALGSSTEPDETNEIRESQSESSTHSTPTSSRPTSTKEKEKSGEEATPPRPEFEEWRHSETFVSSTTDSDESDGHPKGQKKRLRYSTPMSSHPTPKKDEEEQLMDEATPTGSTWTPPKARPSLSRYVTKRRKVNTPPLTPREKKPPDRFSFRKFGHNLRHRGAPESESEAEN